MSDLLALLVAGMIGAFISAVACYVWGRGEGPDYIIGTDTTVVDLRFPKAPPAEPPEPATRVIYQPLGDEDTEEDCFRLPVDYTTHGMITRQPLQLTPTQATITYFQPTAGRYEQVVYDVPRPRFRLWLEPELAFLPVGTMLTAPLGFTWNRFSGWGGLAAVGGGYSGGPQHLTLGWAAGLSYRFTIFER